MEAPDSAPSRPRPAAIRRSLWGRNFSGYTHLFETTSYEHLLFDLHALNTFTHQFGEKALPLIPKRQSVIARHARHTFLNVYRRLFSVMIVLNLSGLAALLGMVDATNSSRPPNADTS